RSFRRRRAGPHGKIEPISCPRDSPVRSAERGRTGRGRRVQRSLVDRAMQGDVEAFDALARLVGDACMAIAFRILRDADQADDAVQAALIAAWRDIRTLRAPERFEPWLHRILINKCYAE